MIWPPDRLWLTPAPVYCAFYDLHGLKNPNCSRFVEPSGLSWYLVACWRIVVDIESETGTSGAARNLVQLKFVRASRFPTNVHPGFHDDVKIPATFL